MNDGSGFRTLLLCHKVLKDRLALVTPQEEELLYGFHLLAFLFKKIRLIS